MEFVAEYVKIKNIFLVLKNKKTNIDLEVMFCYKYLSSSVTEVSRDMELITLTAADVSSSSGYQVYTF